MKIRVKFANGKRRTITGVDILYRLHQANAVLYRLHQAERRPLRTGHRLSYLAHLSAASALGVALFLSEQNADRRTQDDESDSKPD